jgi:hypothetical protein
MAHQATLTWTASTDAVAGYNVYRSTNPPGNEGATPINAALVTGTTYVDTPLIPGLYGYTVTSVEGGVESVHTAEVTARILPAPPTNVSVSAV